MQEYTTFEDFKNQIIREGDILLNPMICDLWVVEIKNDIYYAYLVPSSGMIGHPERTEYPAYIEELEDVAEVFEIIGNKYDNPELLNN